jgi:predicted O-methyltransferase YrrM
MLRVRPHQVFHMVPADRRECVMRLPTAGALPAVEAALLIALQKAVRPRMLFEFGTFRGDTTWMLAANLDDPDGSVYTLDLPDLDGVTWAGADRLIAEQGMAQAPTFVGTACEDRIVRLRQDSMTFDAEPLRGRFQYVFVDGNHHEDYVRRDTQSALILLESARLSCLAWHDYGNEHHPELTRYLDALSEHLPLVHIEETSLVVMVDGLDIAPRSSATASTP